MTAARPIAVDVLILGGGAAGLWLLDELVRGGHRVLLLEAHALGAGQTIASQGIIHGGLKYTLTGMLTTAARTIRDMPIVWRRCLAGERAPDLSTAKVRAEFCHLWRTRAITSRMAMIGARAGLRVGPVPLEPDARPAALRACPGTVARLDEQVVDPGSVLTAMAARHARHVLRIDAASGLEISARGGGAVDLVRLINPDTGAPCDLVPRAVVLTAGAGNDDLRAAAGLAQRVGQRRPLHMVMARGSLPMLNGHCVDGMRTRATITSVRDFADRVVWQVGGQIAEDGVEMDDRTLIRHARAELEKILPGVSLASAEWSTYRVDRAEAERTGGRRPSGATVIREGSVITGWPTKLALVPDLVREIQRHLPAPDPRMALERIDLRDWPRPDVAVPPWEEQRTWTADA